MATAKANVAAANATAHANAHAAHVAKAASKGVKAHHTSVKKK